MTGHEEDSQRTDTRLRVSELCRNLLALAGVDGAAVTVVSGSSRELVYATDAVAQYLDELQFTTGQGPCIDAFRRRTVVSVPDLTDEASIPWPGFAADAAAGGMAAVFAFPLRAGGDVFGVVELYRTVPGALDDEILAVAQVSADALASVLLQDYLRPESVGARPGAEYATNAHTPRRHVNLAVGMISVQLGVPPDEALARLRAAAYSERRPIDDLARDVVDRTTRFTSDDTTSDSTTKGQQS